MNSKNCKPSTSAKRSGACADNDERPSSSTSSSLSRINASFAQLISTFSQCFTSKRTSRGGYNSRMAARRANEASSSSFIRYYDYESDDDDIPPPPLPPKKRVFFPEVPTVTRNIYYCNEDQYPDFEEIFIGPQNAFEKPSSPGTVEIPPPAKMLSRGAAAHPRR